MSSKDRSNVQNQLEHLQNKYVGTGHPDLTKFEWMVNQQRDSYASYIGHRSLLYYMSVAENQPIAKTKYEFLERMAR
eukprot:gene10914-3619_t